MAPIIQCVKRTAVATSEQKKFEQSFSNWSRHIHSAVMGSSSLILMNWVSCCFFPIHPFQSLEHIRFFVCVCVARFFIYHCHFYHRIMWFAATKIDATWTWDPIGNPSRHHTLHIFHVIYMKWMKLIQPFFFYFNFRFLSSKTQLISFNFFFQ